MLLQDRLQKITTSKHVDEWVVCALFGFSTVEDYYTAASTTTYIPSIKTHTLLLVAQDDPFLGRMPLQVRMLVFICFGCKKLCLPWSGLLWHR